MKVMTKEQAFAEAYPQLKSKSDPLWNPAWETFSHIWDNAYFSGLSKGYGAVMDSEVEKEVSQILMIMSNTVFHIPLRQD